MRILLVEDDADHAELAIRALRPFAVVRVGSVAEAVHACQVDRFDVVVADLTLPDSDGVDTVRKIATLGVPVVALTSSGEEIAPEIVRAGAAEYVRKGEPLQRAVRTAYARPVVQPGLRKRWAVAAALAGSLIGGGAWPLAVAIWRAVQ